MKKRSVCLLITTLLASFYAIYLLIYFSGGVAPSADTSEAIGGAIATALVLPHMILFLAGAIFSWIGYFLRANWGALVAAILYSVGTLFFLAYFMFGVPLLVLGFISYAKQKKLNLQQSS